MLVEALFKVVSSSHIARLDDSVSHATYVVVHRESQQLELVARCLRSVSYKMMQKTPFHPDTTEFFSCPIFEPARYRVVIYPLFVQMEFVRSSISMKSQSNLVPVTVCFLVYVCNSATYALYIYAYPQRCPSSPKLPPDTYFISDQLSPKLPVDTMQRATAGGYFRN